MKIYNFALNCGSTESDDFIRALKAESKQEGLSFLWIHENNVREIVKKLENHTIQVQVLLDIGATYNLDRDWYARACYAVKDAGGTVINDPDRTKTAIDKSVMHFELQHAEIPTPYTVVVRNWEPHTFRLTEQEKHRLGTPFVIKPALGYASKGVVYDARGTVREIADARNYDRGDNFLLQEKIEAYTFGTKRSWFRVLNVFDTIIPCWWDDRQKTYEHIDYEEFNRFRLLPLVKMTAQIAAISRMAWFSTEIAFEKKEGRARFVVIDYVNDQCDMTTQSESPTGVPDEVVNFVALRIIQAAARIIDDQSLRNKYTVFLKGANLEIRGLGQSPDLIRQKSSDIANQTNANFSSQWHT
jgi:glutathione synthase/RimK-type ligase-like ATP-grasp enzyme